MFNHHVFYYSTIRNNSKDLRPIPCWDCEFESPRGHTYVSLVSVVCCQVQVSATGLSIVEKSPTDCGVSLCAI